MTSAISDPLQSLTKNDFSVARYIIIIIIKIITRYICTSLDTNLEIIQNLGTDGGHLPVQRGSQSPPGNRIGIGDDDDDNGDDMLYHHHVIMQ